MKKPSVRNFAFLALLLCLTLVAAYGEQAKKQGEPVVLTVEVFDRAVPGYQADNNYWTKYIQENFGNPNNITVKFVTVLRAEEVPKVNLLMASGDAPDICFTYDRSTIYNFVKQGGLTDAGPLLDKYGQNLKKYLGKLVLDTGIMDGRQYVIPAKRVLTGSFSAFIRQDWLDKLGLPMPKTTDEWYKTMKAFKEKDPGGFGDKTIPFALMTNTQNITWVSQMLVDIFKKQISDEDVACLPQWLVPGFKDGMRLMNKMYNEGLISPEFPLDKDSKQYDKDISQGKVGFIIHNMDYPYRSQPGLSIELAKSVQGGKLVPCNPFVNDRGKHYLRVYGPNGMFIFIPKFSKHAVEAIKYLDWMSDQKNLGMFINGVEGINYKEVKDGIPININVEGEMRIVSFDIPIIVNGKDFGDSEKNIRAGALSTPDFYNEWIKAYKISIDGDQYFTTFFPIESEAKLRSSLFEKETEIFIKTITCKPADFDSLYETLVNEYMKMGGQTVLDDRRAFYPSLIIKN